MTPVSCISTRGSITAYGGTISALVRSHPDLPGVGVGVTGLGRGVTVAAALVVAAPEVGSGVAVGRSVAFGGSVALGKGVAVGTG